MIKQALKFIDQAVLSNAASRNLLKLRHKGLKQRIKQENLYSIEILYEKNKTNVLAGLFDFYGSDKGSNMETGHVYDWEPKSYSDIYSLLFEAKRQSVERVFECGIGTNNPALPSSMGVMGKPGASLRAWRDYFPNAKIYGADIDKTVLFEEERIKTGFVDQLEKTSIEQLLEEFRLTDLDIVIDDGLHIFEAARNMFEVASNRLAIDGVYVIEDIHPSEIRKFTKYFKSKSIKANYAVFSSNDSIPVGSLVWINAIDIKKT